MPQVKELLVEELQDMLHAETQLTAALPKLEAAAHHPKLKEAFRRHLAETEKQISRLQDVFALLGEKAEPKPCKAMMGLIAEGAETMEDGKQKDPLIADLALIASAQRVEHYEIAAYGTARGLARQLGELESARLLSQTLAEEERTDFLLTALSDPLIQQATLNDLGGNVNLDKSDVPAAPRQRKTSREPQTVA